jgi:hypothetical protein
MIFGFLEDARRRDENNDTPGKRPGRSTRGATASVLGEGAWMVVLEREDHSPRAARPSTRPSTGMASTCDAYHWVQMDPDGQQIVRAMRLAIRRRAARSTRLATSTSRRRLCSTTPPSRCAGSCSARQRGSVPPRLVDDHIRRVRAAPPAS